MRGRISANNKDLPGISAKMLNKLLPTVIVIDDLP